MPPKVSEPPMNHNTLTKEAAMSQSVRDARRKVDEELDGDPPVLGDTRFRIVDEPEDAELIEATALHPAPHERLRKPFAPAQLEAHARLQERDARQCRGDRQC
jgi:hypothetical protein